ncbi:MAG: adenosylmethionine decarboxylase [Silicimonas sp.]|jgi:S-adenosylmethionine decarboxylase|nr:adenosylmethionine decarboxylase [Silicimonas sp.]
MSSNPALIETVDIDRAQGRHLIVELNGGKGLDDPSLIERALRRAVRASGAELLHLHLHRFSPQGVTGVALLAESHITVHTWPEHGYGAFDVFMCGRAEPEEVVPVLAEAFETDDVQVRVLERGPRRL